jgi:4-hydroxybenzoate polyprenyltransferase
MPYFRLMRPHQWVKNVFVFAGVVFAKQFDAPGALIAAVLAFACLSLVSSAVYILNDLNDREEDRLHPRKRQRPLASGAADPTWALVLAVVCAAVGLINSYVLRPEFFVLAALYFLMQMAYTGGLKRAALVDVIIIATGFVLRAVAGAVVVYVEISIWLILCTFTLCLFMGFSKRRCELDTLDQSADAGRHRRTLLRYNPEMLTQMTTLSAGIAVISFVLYATDNATVAKFGTQGLAYTLPLVVYAIFRFTLLVETRRVDGPTDVLLKDRPFQISLVLWVLAALVVIYYGPAIEAAIARF